MYNWSALIASEYAAKIFCMMTNSSKVQGYKFKDESALNILIKLICEHTSKFD